MTTSFSIQESSNPGSVIDYNTFTPLPAVITANVGTWLHVGYFRELYLDISLGGALLSGSNADIGTVTNPPSKTIYGELSCTSATCICLVSISTTGTVNIRNISTTDLSLGDTLVGNIIGISL
jgi:hypothetical protein